MASLGWKGLKCIVGIVTEPCIQDGSEVFKNPEAESFCDKV
jgi:hypothetical protein